MLTQAFYILFGLVSIVGGAIGYARAKSKASLIAGGVSGALLIIAGLSMALLGGVLLIAASSWTSTVDEYSQAWSGCLAEAISKAEAERALNEVAPLENYFSQEGNLEAAFTESGFSVVHAGAVDLDVHLSVEQFVEDREINSGGRLGRHLLGNDKWMNFRDGAITILRARFGDTVRYRRRALVVIGQKSRQPL